MGYDPNRSNSGNPIKLINKSAEDILKDKEAARLQNELIEQWAPKVRTALKGSAARFNDGKTQSFVMRHNGDQREGKLANSIKYQPKKSFGDIYGVSFKFERHGIFVYKGTGRSYSAKGGQLRRSNAFLKKTHNNKEMSLHEKINARTINRQPVDWFNPIIVQNLPELANRLAEIRADAVLNAGKLLIP